MSEKSQSQNKDGVGPGCWFCIAFFWCSITLLFDCITGQQFLSQWQTSTYLETVGTITHSKVKVESDTDGTSYSPEIHYNYHVDGEQYSGEVYKFIHNFDSRKYVRNIVKEHPVGKEVPVYYHPDQPQKAVLFKGFEMRDAMPLIFLLPFNGIALIVFCAPLTLGLERLFRNDNHWFRDFPIRNDGLTIRLRTGSFSVILSAIVGMSIAAFCSIGFLFLLDTGIVALLGSVATILGGLYGIWLAVRWNHSDRYILVVDKMYGTLRLPRQPDKTPGPVVPFDSIEDLVYSTREGKSSDDSDVHTLTLHYRVEDKMESAIVISSDHNWSPPYFTSAEEECLALKDWILRETHS